MLSTILFAATACLLVGVNADIHSHSNATAVPVELFVMSKCPDAVHCEATFDKVCKCFWFVTLAWIISTHYRSVKQISVPITLDINFIAQPAPFEPLKFSW